MLGKDITTVYNVQCANPQASVGFNGHTNLEVGFLYSSRRFELI